MQRVMAVALGAAIAAASPVAIAGAALEPHAVVRGPDVTMARVRAAGATWREIPWDDLGRTPLEAGPHEVQFQADGGANGAWVQVPPCAGRERVMVDGRSLSGLDGPIVTSIGAGWHDVRILVRISRYELRVACGERPRVGTREEHGADGLGVLTFPSRSAAKGGGRAVVFVPTRHDPTTPAPLLVGLHPWNGSIWTYAAYAELLREATLHDVVLLLPSGLGNSLYTSEAEDEVLAAIGAVSELIAVDQRAVSLWGASMGGAGATTIGFHHPDRFASVVSFFGDSRYDTRTYVRSILPDDAAAHLVNALDVVDNARHLPVWLVHGEADRTSPVAQSEVLAAALADRGFQARFDRVPDAGHAGALVARFLPEVVALAAGARVPAEIARVTFRSVRSSDTRAYGVTLERASPRVDAFVDVERRGDGVHVIRAEGVRGIVLARGALGTEPARPPPIVLDVPWDGRHGTPPAARWEARP
ncbi:MAG: prolyl oligopeptidase family serine peptidase [Myxococcales bacterium]|nr:prolyl oligopeptidase family serine peptidase [Myxococcales bacterium]